MNLKELKHMVDKIYSYSRYPEEIEVVITTSENAIGGRAKCGVLAIHQGIDWERKQLRIEPENKLIKKDG